MKRKNKDEGGTERPKLVIQEGFVTPAENDVLAVAQDLVAKVLARYDEAARAAGRKPGYAPRSTMQVNPLGAGWAVRDISSGCEAHGTTLEHALRNLASQTDADRLRHEAEDLRRRADNLERQAAGMEYRMKRTEGGAE